jgi:PAS domain S-box-containing protein
VPDASQRQQYHCVQDPAGGEPLRVLIIDDTPEDRMVVRMALETQGFMLNEAQNGESGIAAARALSPDCILLDYRLPDLDGLEVLDALRGSDGEMPYAVVMLTGSNNGPTAAKLLNAGALDYLSKDHIGDDSVRRAVIGAAERFRGIEERRRLREHNARLAAVVNASTDAIISLGLDLVVLTWNPGAQNLFGYGEDEAVGTQLDELIVDESSPQGGPHHYDDIVSRRQAVIVEAVRRHKDGTPIEVEINAAPIVKEDGGVIGISVILRDIRERKNAQKLVDTVMKSAPVSIYVLNVASGANELINDRAGELLGYDPESWRGLMASPLALIHPEDVPKLAEHLDRLDGEASGAPLTLEYRMRHADGGWRWFLSRDIVFERRADGKLSKVLGTAMDITDRRETEIALREVTTG